MDWIQFSLSFIGVFGLFLWNRAESRSDIRHMDNQLKANRDLIYEIRNENQEMIKAIHAEMKDFHARLCVIEEKRSL